MPFKPGSIIKRPLKGWYAAFSWVVGIRWHMGIYLGNDVVIHFNGEKTSRNAVVCRDSLAAFACGERVRLHASPTDARHAEQVCTRAQQIHSEQDNPYNHKYSFVFNNCEDFVLACFQIRSF